MTYKTILVHAGDDPVSVNRLRAATALATRFDSHLIALGAYGWTPVVDLAIGYAEEPAVNVFVEDVEADVRAAKRVFDQTFAGAPRVPEWREDVAMPDRAMLAQVHCADLIVASPKPARGSATRVADPAKLVMESGAPVLLCPGATEKVGLGAVLIGWKNTRECRRVIADALPLLKAADTVLLIGIVESTPQAELQSELEDVVERLGRHGVVATWEIASHLDIPVSEQLAGLVRGKSADLLVLGAYGHSRLREWAFGGVTKDVLAAPPCPTLLGR